MSFSPDILGEIQKLQTADWYYSSRRLWWLSAPAILKGWFDRVLAMGFAWDTGKIFENGLLRGKQAIVVTTGRRVGRLFQAGRPLPGHSEPDPVPDQLRHLGDVRLQCP